MSELLWRVVQGELALDEGCRYSTEPADANFWMFISFKEAISAAVDGRGCCFQETPFKTA